MFQDQNIINFQISYNYVDSYGLMLDRILH